MKLSQKKLFKINKSCNYALFHSGEKFSFLTKSFYFHWKGFLSSSAYRKCFKDLFHKSARALLGLISEACITLSKAITLTLSFLPQLSSWSICNRLVSYLNASFTPTKTCESHLFWLTSYSARHKKTKGNFAIGVTGHCAYKIPQELPPVLFPAPHVPAALAGKTRLPGGLLCSEGFGVSRRRSETDQTHRILLLNREGAGSTKKSLLCNDLGGKETLRTFSAVIKSRKHKT